MSASYHMKVVRGVVALTARSARMHLTVQLVRRPSHGDAVQHAPRTWSPATAWRRVVPDVHTRTCRRDSRGTSITRVAARRLANALLNTSSGRKRIPPNAKSAKSQGSGMCRTSPDTCNTP